MTPQEKMQAYQSVQKLGKMFPGVIESFQEWATIGSLEQAKKEAQAEIDKTRAAIEAAHRDWDVDIAKRKADADADLAKAREHLQCVKNDAILRADQIDRKANEDAAALIAKANAELKLIKDQHVTVGAAIGDRETMLDALDSDITDAARELDEWQAKISTAKSEHARITALIAELKAKLTA